MGTRLMLNYLLSLWVMLLCLPVAQADSIEDGRLWLMFNANGKLPMERLRWYAELQPRFREEASQFDQLLIRPAAYYALTDHSSLWLGYAFVETDPAGRESFSEHRLWQQYLHTFEPIYNITLQSRTRYEQRWLENSSDTGYRLRQMFRLTMPSGIHPKLTWVAWDEYFVHLNTTDFGARKGFDQNRAFVGGNWTFDNKHRLEIGYLNQYINSRRMDNQNHVLSATLNLNF